MTTIYFGNQEVTVDLETRKITLHTGGWDIEVQQERTHNLKVTSVEKERDKLREQMFFEVFRFLARNKEKPNEFDQDVNMYRLIKILLQRHHLLFKDDKDIKEMIKQIQQRGIIYERRNAFYAYTDPEQQEENNN